MNWPSSTRLGTGESKVPVSLYFGTSQTLMTDSNLSTMLYFNRIPLPVRQKRRRACGRLVRDNVKAYFSGAVLITPVI